MHSLLDARTYKFCIKLRGGLAEWAESGVVLSMQKSVSSLSVNGVTEAVASVPRRTGESDKTPLPCFDPTDFCFVLKITSLDPGATHLCRVCIQCQVEHCLATASSTSGVHSNVHSLRVQLLVCRPKPAVLPPGLHRLALDNR